MRADPARASEHRAQAGRGGVGTALLVAAVVGSGIMVQSLAKDPAIMIAVGPTRDIAGFIGAQCIGAATGARLFTWLVPLRPPVAALPNS